MRVNMIRTRLIWIAIGVFALLPFAVTSCLMNDSEDIPDFYEQLEKDLHTIDNYLATNGIAAQQDIDGFIRYVIVRDVTDTDKPTIDSCATVNYAGFLMSDGSKFDEGKNFSFPVYGVIDGWKVGIPLLNVGDSAIFYIPSGLAYGYNGLGGIPSNANLIFHVGLTKIGSTYRQTDFSCD